MMEINVLKKTHTGRGIKKGERDEGMRFVCFSGVSCLAYTLVDTRKRIDILTGRPTCLDMLNVFNK